MLYQIVRPSEPAFIIPGTSQIVNTTTDSFGELHAIEAIVNDKHHDKTCGLIHSRRFFTIDGKPATNEMLNDKIMLHNIIVCNYSGNTSNSMLYYSSHKDSLLLDACKRLVAEKPEYKIAVELMLNGNILFLHNMFYGYFADLKLYQKFLDSTLFKWNLASTNDKDCNRHLGERFFTIWVLHNFAIKDIITLPVTCMSRDLLKPVNTTNGLDFTK